MECNITAKEFAKTYAYHRVKVDKCAELPYVDWTLPGERLKMRKYIDIVYAVVIGYTTKYPEDVVVYFEDERYADKHYPVYDFVPTTNKIYGWRIKINHLTLCEKPIFPPTKSIKPYPHICKRCKAPSRNGSQFTICSNSKCRTNREIRRVLRNKPAKFI